MINTTQITNYNLTLSADQFDALYSYLEEVVEYLEGEMDTTEDDNGNEVLEDISKYEAHQIYQQLVSLKDDAKVTITDDDYADQVDTLVSKMAASNVNEYTHDSEGC